MNGIQRALKLETDSLDIVQEVVKATRKGGNIALIGDYFDYGNGFPIGAYMEKFITMRGGQVFVQKYWPTILTLIETGKLDPTKIITHRMSLNEADVAYKMFAYQQDNCIKIVLEPRAKTA